MARYAIIKDNKIHNVIVCDEDFKDQNYADAILCPEEFGVGDLYENEVFERVIIVMPNDDETL